MPRELMKFMMSPNELIKKQAKQIQQLGMGVQQMAKMMEFQEKHRQRLIKTQQEQVPKRCSAPVA